MKKLRGEFFLIGPQRLLGKKTDLAILLNRHVGQYRRQLSAGRLELVGGQQPRPFAQSFDGKRVTCASSRLGPWPLAVAVKSGQPSGQHEAQHVATRKMQLICHEREWDSICPGALCIATMTF